MGADHYTTKLVGGILDFHLLIGLHEVLLKPVLDQTFSLFAYGI